jgi:iron(III) transport system substrate-binding protein
LKALAIAAFAAAVSLTAPARADDTPQGLYEQAKKEGLVSIWSSLDVEMHQAQLKIFSQRFPGLRIEAFKIQPGPAIERAIAESRAGRLTVDVMDTNSGYLQLVFDRDLARPYPWQKVFGVPDDLALYDNRALMIGHYDLPIAYNTDLVKPGEIASWEDLTLPKWKGKFMLEARGFGLAILAQEWGEEKTVAYIRRLVANQPIITKGASPTMDGLASGQASAAIGAIAARVQKLREQGAPLEWARVGPIPAQVVTVFPVVGAPHPAAAKLWSWWWTTPEGQKAFYDEQGYGLLTGPRANPRGLELKAKGLPIVFETGEVEKGRRNLEVVAQAIDGLK